MTGTGWNPLSRQPCKRPLDVTLAFMKVLRKEVSSVKSMVRSPLLYDVERTGQCQSSSHVLLKSAICPSNDSKTHDCDGQFC